MALGEGLSCHLVLTEALGIPPAPLPPAADLKNTRREQTVERLPLLETSEMSGVEQCIWCLRPHPSSECPQHSPEKSQDKKVKLSRPQMQHPTATVNTLV